MLKTVSILRYLARRIAEFYNATPTMNNLTWAVLSVLLSILTIGASIPIESSPAGLPLLPSLFQK